MKSFSILISPKWILAALVLILFCNNLQAQECGSVAKDQFSLATVCGDYGAIATYGPNIARALAFEVMDGHGNLHGAATVNQPGPNDTRSITKIELSGTYTVDENGMGRMDLTIGLPGGGSASVSEDFVITKTKMINGVLIATEMEDAQQVPSAVIDDSSLVVHTYTLRRVLKSCLSGH